MQSHESRSGVEIPDGIKVDDIMRSLAIGHGYKWTVLTRKPLIIALLLTGTKPMVISGGDIVYVERIRNVLEMLLRQSHRIQFTQEEE